MNHSLTTRARSALVAAALLLAAALPGPFFASTDLDARVADLVELLEEKRAAHHVPGMSIVVVHEGRGVLARGFGVTNLETDDPVTDEPLVRSRSARMSGSLPNFLVQIRWSRTATG